MVAFSPEEKRSGKVEGNLLNSFWIIQALKLLFSMLWDTEKNGQVRGEG